MAQNTLLFSFQLQINPSKIKTASLNLRDDYLVAIKKEQAYIEQRSLKSRIFVTADKRSAVCGSKNKLRPSELQIRANGDN